MLDRYHLNIVLMVHTHGTLTEAARQLCLTQSALSHAIKKLEQELGTVLWTKQGRSLHFTQAGYSVLGLAQRVLPQFESTEAQVKGYAEGKRGVLRLGVECHPCHQWLLKVIAPFLHEHPGVDVDIRQAFQFGALHALINHDIDLIITPDPLYIPKVAYTKVFDYHQVLMVSQQHTLAQRDFVSATDLSQENLITYPIEPSRLDIFSMFLTPQGGTVKRHQTIENTEILMQMVAANRGVAALPDWLVETQCESLNVVGVPLSESGLAKSLYIGYRADEPLVDYMQAFVDAAREIGQQMQ